MIRNYLLIALRHVRRHKAYSAINVGGLAVGMAACLLIGLYVQDELSYDRFHANADRLYVVGMESGFREPVSVTPYPLASTLEADLPEVQDAIRTQGGGELPVMQAGTTARYDRRVLFADAAFFDVFSFPLVEGDAASALASPTGVVVTAETARQLFGDADPLGQSLTFEQFGQTYTLAVTGVAQDVPSTSTIQFDLVVPLAAVPAEFTTENGWRASMFDTYLLTDRPVPPEALDAAIAAAVRPHLEGDQPARPRARAAAGRDRAAETRFFALPLPDLYLSDLYSTDGFTGQTRYLYIFGSVALLILLIAAFNYVNLVTAQAGGRAREVGVRKAMGAGRAQLARQFLAESVLTSVVALVVALGLTVLALPAFNGLFGKALTLDHAAVRPALLGLSAVVLAVGVAAGVYPALVLSRFQPSRVLRSAAPTSTGGGGWLRRGLVVTQFTITSALLLGTAVIYQQLRYVQAKDLGFEGEQVVVVDLPEGMPEERAESLRQEALAHPGVQMATVADAVPGRFMVSLGSPPEDVSPVARTEEEIVRFRPSKVDVDFVETLGLELLAGRSFRADRPSDRQHAYVLNRAAVEAMGWTVEEAVGQPFTLSEGSIEGEVVGVMEDFHVESLRSAIAPVVLLMENDSFSAGSLLAARLAPEDVRGAMTHIERQWERYAPDEPFDYTFLDDEFDAMYEAEMRLSRIFSVFAAIAVVIACLGLFGLAAFTTAQRTREVGIRKALGASVPHLVGLLSRDFAVLVVVALAIGVPLAYVLMERWLEDFAYHIEVGAGTFALTAALALLIAGLSVGYQSLKAALSDPVRALRSE